MKKFIRCINNKKGSSILTVVIVMVVLVLLGHAITVLALGTLNNNVADASNNDAYYAAESAATSAVNQLKYEVVSYYQSMKDAGTAEYSAMLASFENNIAGNSQSHFNEPEFDSCYTYTTFSTGAYDAVNNVCEFLVQSVSMTPDNASYQVNASIMIKKIDISVSGGQLSIPDNAALIVGGLMDLDYDSGIGVNGGDVIVAGITYESTKKNKVPYNISGGDLYIDPNIGDVIDDPFVYPSFTVPSMPTPDIYATSDMTVDWGNVPASPVSITSAPGVKLTLSCNIGSGIVYSGGDMDVINGSYDVDLYCDGDLYLESCDFDGDIYVRGNFTGSNAVIRGDLYCDGNVSWSSGYSVGNIVSGGNVDVHNASSVCNIAASGNVEISSVGINAGLIYSSGDCTIGNCSVTAVLYSYGDVVITGGMYLQGAIVAKEDFYFSNPGPYMNMGYSASFVQQIVDDANLDLFGGDGGGGTAPTLDSTVFVSEKITPIGRIN